MVVLTKSETAVESWRRVRQVIIFVPRLLLAFVPLYYMRNLEAGTQQHFTNNMVGFFDQEMRVYRPV